MPAINHTAYPEKVERGIKRCSIRAYRKRPFKVGDTLYHFSGMRTKKCRRLMTVPCESVYDLEITAYSVTLDGKLLGPGQIRFLAYSDGFNGELEFTNYFVKNQADVFRGQLIEWCPGDATYWPAGGKS